MMRFATLLFTSLLGLRVAVAATTGAAAGAGYQQARAAQALPVLRASNTAKLGRATGLRLAQPTASPAAWPSKFSSSKYLPAAFIAGLGQTPAPALSLYPNPARGQTMLQINGPGGADYKVRLSNVLGSEVRRLPVRPENAPTTDGVALDLSDLPPGLYFCSLLVNDKTLVTKRLTVL